MRIVLFGYSSIGARVLQTLLETSEDVVAVFTHRDNPAEAIWFDSVAEIARTAGIPVHFVSTGRPRGPAPYKSALEHARPDVILSATFRAVLPSDVLSVATTAALNLHPSLLPRYRGRCPVNWVLIHGEKETGMTLHHMVREPDAGDIVGQVRLRIGPDETAPQLQKRMEDAAAQLVLTFLPQIKRRAAPRLPQDSSKSTTLGGRRPEDGLFQWTWPARRIHDLVRAVTRPYPGAFVDGLTARAWWSTRASSQALGARKPRPNSPVKSPPWKIPHGCWRARETACSRSWTGKRSPLSAAIIVSFVSFRRKLPGLPRTCERATPGTPPGTLGGSPGTPRSRWR